MNSLQECLSRFHSLNLISPTENDEELDAVKCFLCGILQPSTTAATVACFTPCLPQLLTELPIADSPVIDLVVALCRIAVLRSSYASVIAEQLRRASLPFGLISQHPVLSQGEVCLHLIALLQSVPSLKAVWKLKHWTVLLNSADPEVRWCGIIAISEILNLSEDHSKRLCNLYSISSEKSLEYAVKLAQVKDEHCPTLPKTSDLAPPLTMKTAPELNRTSQVVDIMGIQLAVSRRDTSGIQNPDLESSRKLIRTQSIEQSFLSMALALKQNQAVLLEGPPGCGKTTMIEEIQLLTDNQDAVHLQIDDQMDSKSLLGAYVCTSIPGEFRWQQGPLVEAVSQGKWIIIEDFNLAPAQVLASLVPLLESGKLPIPQRGEVLEAQEGFQLITTVTTAPHGLSSGAYASVYQVEDILGGLLTQVVINNPSLIDQILILRTSFPVLEPVMTHALSCLLFIQRAADQIRGSDLTENPKIAVLVERCLERSGSPSFHIGRHLSLRDVFKWCQRMTTAHYKTTETLKFKDNNVEITQLSFAFRNAALAECYDCYVVFIPKVELRRQLMMGLAALWCLTETDVENLTKLQKPVIQVEDSIMKMGRAKLPILDKWTSGIRKDSLFVHTGHSARLMEQVSLALELNESILLVGETGTGKTALIQHIANQVNVKLIVMNLSQQTDSSELMGGFKPVSAKEVLLPLVNPFIELLRRTWIKGNNETFISKVLKFAEKEDWTKLRKSFEIAISKTKKSDQDQEQVENLQRRESKRQKLLSHSILLEWGQFESEMTQAFKLHTSVSSTFAFTFIEGTLLKAMKQGYWLFLDEINLSPPEALQALASVLEPGSNVHLTLPDKGSHAVQKHPNFRLIGAMNPATDSGKRDLATPLRNKFTEFWVSEAQSIEDLELLVSSYLSPLGPSMPISNIVRFYLKMKEVADGGLYDGGGQSPCYSLRTLCRLLDYLKNMIGSYGLDRALYDAVLMTFVTQLESKSITKGLQLIAECLLKQKLNSKVLTRIPKRPSGLEVVLFEEFWIERGPEEIPDLDSISPNKFVLTPSIRMNLRNIARALVLRKYPILLQGPTSSGKTSLVSYIASQTGHKMIRINNHKHTDLQEYLGSYIANEQGQLEFVDGALVQAVKYGHWIVLDELNLAPSEVLEALNRLLDDNRELFVPDLQQTIKPHPHFMLFATQNPPGIYSGRKHLSRAFRSRFLEINVDDILDEELAEILELRSRIPGSYAKRMIEVMRELQRRRQTSNTFAGKFGFITPRDLFRWAERPADGYLQLAQNGYYVLAERLRSEAEKKVVQEVLCKVMKVELGELYGAQIDCPGLVWIPSTCRIYTLLEKCLESSESALLIGETGTGKTTVCQKLAQRNGQKLHILNCNLHTETSDFIGGYRPVRDRSKQLEHFRQLCQEFDGHRLWEQHGIDPKTPSPESNLGDLDHKTQFLQNLTDCLNPKSRKHGLILEELKMLLKRLKVCASNLQMPFVWEDGVLVEAMKNGDMILIDEVNLAEDAVLERMNSVLDPNRSITLAEKGGNPSEMVIAHPSFRLIATMNPGGDFGKKELSPALTNRFTQIWVPQIQCSSELTQIITSQLGSRSERDQLSQTLVGFYSTFQQQMKAYRQVLTLRDVLSVVNFTNLLGDELGNWSALLHGIFMVFLDGMDTNLPTNGIQSETVHDLRSSSYQYLKSTIPEIHQPELELATGRSDLIDHHLDQQGLSIGPFKLPLGPFQLKTEAKYDISAPTPKKNLFRLLRAMQLRKAVLLEGSPGVGKTSLIVNLAHLTGHRLIRINLSEQTDMMDLLGSDLPLIGGQPGEFRWSDGPLLSAIKAGFWILLDELNLANQQVLEGLNALIDHRAEIYIPELKESFHCPSSFRLFASQNPTSQGGGRKGLPKSFLNRFTRVFLDSLDQADMEEISTALSGHLLDHKMLHKMVWFLDQLSLMCKEGRLGLEGGPWEFNLRDFLRWSEIVEECVESDQRLNKAAQILFLQRFRSVDDRNLIKEVYKKAFGSELELQNPRILISEKLVVVGDEILTRNQNKGDAFIPKELYLKKELAPYLESLAITVSKNWPALIVGPSCSGKTSLVRILASLSNQTLTEISLTSGTDTGDLLGGFEQIEITRELQALIKEAQSLLGQLLGKALKLQSKEDLSRMFHLHALVLQLNEDLNKSLETDKRKAESVIRVLTESFIAFKTQFSGSCDLGSSIDDFLSKASCFEVESSRSGCFSWVDGALVKAMEQGNWILLDHANLCNSSVLDRLNAVLEPGGSLHLNECGTIDNQNGTSRIIHPHPNFRIFLSYNPKHGEISRAMRNRAIEVYLPQEISVMSDCILDLPTMWNAVFQVHDLSICSSLGRAHQDSTSKARHQMGLMPSIRDYKRAVQISRSLLKAGEDSSKALEAAWEQVYVQSKEGVHGTSLEGDFRMETGFVPNWMLLGMSVFRAVSDSSFSALCKETLLFWKHLSDSESTKCLIFRIMVPRLNPTQLLYLQHWLKCCLPSLHEVGYLDALLEQHSIKDFIESSLGTDPVQQLMPLDASYWTSFETVCSRSMSSLNVELLMDWVQVEYEQRQIHVEMDSKSLRQNSVLQLSFIRSQDQHFRLNSTSISPLLIEWLFPVFLALKNILRDGLDSAQERPDLQSLHKRLFTLLAQFWHHWSQTDVKSCHQSGDFMESVLYIWIKIKKYMKSLLAANSSHTKSIEEWKIASKGLNKALGLPEDNSQKLLLWKHGGHPKLHRSLSAVVNHSKLQQLSQMFTVNTLSPSENTADIIDILPELQIFKTKTGSTPDVNESEIKNLILQLKGDVHLRKILVEGLSMTSLAAYSSKSSLESDQITTAVLEMSIKAIQASFHKSKQQSGLQKDSNSFEVFLSPDHLSNPANVDLQLDLASFHWSLTSSKVFPSTLEFMVEVISSRKPNHEIKQRSLQELKDWVSEGINRSLLPVSLFSSVKNMVWMLEMDSSEELNIRSNALALLGDLMYNWQLTLSTHSVHFLSNQTVVPGASVLYQGTLVNSVESILEKPPTILEASGKLRQLKLAIRQLLISLSMTLQTEALWDRIRVLITTNLVHILASHKSSLPEENHGPFTQLLESVWESMKSKINEDELEADQHLLRCLKSQLRCSQHQGPVSCIDEVVSPCCQSLMKSKRSSGLDTISALGQAWIHLGALRIALVQPPAGLDPSTKQTMKFQSLEFELGTKLRPLLQLRVEINSLAGGFDESEKIGSLVEEVKEIEDRMEVLKEAMVPRPTPSQYLGLFNHIHQFLTTHCNPDRIQNLLKAFQKDWHIARIQSENWIAVCRSFVMQTSQRFPLYVDIWQPLCQGLLEMIHGFSALITFAKLKSSPEELHSKLTSAALELMKVNSPSSDATPMDLNKVLMEAESFFKGNYQEQDIFDLQLQYLIASLHHSKEQVMGLRGFPKCQEAKLRFCSLAKTLMTVFEKLEAMEDSRLQQEAQLFKTKISPGKTDEELVEESYQNMFPDEGKYFTDFTEGHLDALPVHGMDTQHQSKSLLDGSVVKKVAQLHQEVYARNLEISNEFELRFGTGLKLLEVVEKTIPRQYDDQVSTGCLLRLCTEHRKLSKKPVMHSSQSCFIDFHQPCPEETQLTHQCLLPLNSRLQKLLEDYPDHPILTQIHDLSTRVLSLSIESPLKRVLTGLELLLSRSQIWEDTVASSKTALSSELKLVSGLVIRWQRMELENWKTVLNRIRTKHGEGARKTWFYIFRILLPSESLDLEDLTSSLEQYLMTATRGEFSERLRILSSFQQQMQEQGRHLLSHVLSNLVALYSHYLDPVQTALNSGLKQIEKELLEFIKLQSWEDRGYYNLKKTGERSQRRLHQFYLRAEEVLKQPMASILSQQVQSMGYPDLIQDPQKTAEATDSAGLLLRPLEVALDDHNTVSKDWSEVLSTVETGSRFQQLPRLILKMQEILKSSWVLQNHDFSASLSDLSDTVITRVRSLQQDKEKNSKNRKKKALSDFLNFLPTLGVSRRRSDIPEDERTVLSWFKQLPLRVNQLPEWTNELKTNKERIQGIFEKADEYYFKSMDRMQRIWQARNQSSHDLTLNEVNSMVNFSEHFLSILRSQRQILEASNCNISNFLAVLKLITGLHSDGQISALPHQESVIDLLLTQWHVLWELKQAVLDEKELLINVSEIEDHVEVSQVIKKYSDQCEECMECINSCIRSLEEIRSERVHSVFLHEHLRTIQKHCELLFTLHSKLKHQHDSEIEFQKLKKLGFGGNTLEDCVPGWTNMINIFNSSMATFQESLDRFGAPPCGSMNPRLFDSDEFQQHIESCIVELMLWFQKQHQEDSTSESSSILDTNLQFQDHFDFNRIDNSSALLMESIKRILIVSECAHKTKDLTLHEQLVKRSALMAKTVQCLEPVGLQITRGMFDLWTGFLEHHKATSKLCYITMSVFLGLIKEGFCNEDAQEGEGEGQGDFDSGDGTGLAKGQGLQDVSEQIENEDQVLGTQNTNEEFDESAKDDQSKGIEMENDFEGVYENIEQEMEEDQDSGDKEEDQLENEMGDVGQEGETVDEQLWNGEENLKENEQTTDDHKTSPPRGEQEYIEGELDASEEDEGEPKTQHKNPEIVSKQQDQEEESPEEGEEELEGESEEGEGPPAEGFTKTELPEEEVQLPEDLNLDNENQDDDQDSLANSENAEPPEMEEPAAQKFPEEESNSSGDIDPMEIDQDLDLASQGDPEVFPDHTNDQEKTLQEQEPTPSEKSSTNGETGTAGHQEGTLDEDFRGQDLGQTSFHENQNSPEDSQAATQPIPSKTGPVENRTEMDQETGQNPEQQEVSHKQSANPLRSLGDALEQWKEDLKVLDQESQDRNPEAQSGDAQEYEFLMGEDPGSLQTVAHATEDQMKQMSDLEKPLQEQEEQDSSLIQEPDEASLQEIQNQEQGPPLLKQFTGARTGPVKSEEQDVKDSESDVEMLEEEETERPVQEKFAHWKLQELDPMIEDQEQDKTDLRIDPVIEDSTQIEIIEGQNLWNQYQASTSTLASELTEHLRLILEPTLASRLAGDYRTGKRINMKRVIPYIASQYRKDKIWLRRTKPDKRKYQVVLAIDDSQSMSNIGCQTFALEALTLISRAMSRLEVGEIGLLSFGGSGKINLLHPLGTPFTDNHGPQILNQMKFDQDNRIEDQPMLQLIKSLDQILDQAETQYCENHELHQLVTIIADGRFHERTALRQAAHKLCSKPGVLVSFIILDNPKNSLIDMATVEFENGEPQFKKYLDHFPFPFYIVLNDISALPRTLADLLRQWFQISSTGS